MKTELLRQLDGVGPGNEGVTFIGATNVCEPGAVLAGVLSLSLSHTHTLTPAGTVGLGCCATSTV